MQNALAVEPNSIVPEEMILVEAYPNPFNPTATIAVNLNEAQSVEVALYDLSGRRITTIHQGMLSAGQHRLTLNGNNLSVGTYLIRVNTPTETVTRSINLVK